MSKMRKKTPKNSKRRAKRKDKKERIVISAIFVAFIVVVGVLFYLTELYDGEESVASVNYKDIKKSDLDWWYHTSILPEHRDLITKEDFLVLSLIPQEVLVQEAEKSSIKIGSEEIEKSLGIFIIDNGWTLEEFEDK